MDEYYDVTFDEFLHWVHQNDPGTTLFDGNGNDDRVQNMTDEEWEVIGEDIANNTHLFLVTLYEGALNDHIMSFFFRGLTRSSTIEEVQLHHNGLSSSRSAEHGSIFTKYKQSYNFGSPWQQFTIGRI